MRRSLLIGGVVAGIIGATVLLWVWLTGRSKTMATVVEAISYAISGGKRDRARVVAPYVEAYRGSIPFGALMAICEHESNFRPDAVNPRSVNNIGHARGLWQIMDGYQADYGVDAQSVHDPDASTRGACRKLGAAHDSLMTMAPDLANDYESYTYCLYLAHFAGRGGMVKQVQKAVDAGQGVTSATVYGFGRENGLRQVAQLAAWWEDQRAELLGVVE